MDAAVHQSAETQGRELVTSTAPERVERVSVEEGYRRWAPQYDSDINAILACEERHVVPLLPNLAGKSVLDLACGTGRWVEKLRSLAPRCIAGLDASSEMLAKARQKPSVRDNIAQGQYASLPFCSSAFEVVVCSFALNHFARLNVLAAELSRVTCDGADVFLTDVHPLAIQTGWRTRFRDAQGIVEIDITRHTTESIQRALQACDFEQISIRSFDIGQPEQELFVRAGKAHLFPAVLRQPAVLFCHFRRARRRDS